MLNLTEVLTVKLMPTKYKEHHGMYFVIVIKFFELPHNIKKLEPTIYIVT